MKVLLISPFHGGSHRAWAEGFKRHSNNEITILSLPDRFWKWRMHGGAVTLARRFIETSNEEPAQSCKTPDAIIATDMLDLTTFVALTKSKINTLPLILYMHENQLTYPLPSDGKTGPMRRQKGERDLHYGFINFASMLVADSVWFNSEYHRQELLAELPRFLKHFPEFNELNSLPRLYQRTEVMPVGVDFEQLRSSQLAISTREAPLILWNQRWEYDKNPKEFFSAVLSVKEKRLPFRLAVCGANFRKQPVEFELAKRKLSSHIVHWGYAEEDEYRRLLWQADITISTSNHEFFGISIVEAIACQTFPLLPRALSYPEIIPEEFNRLCLYDNKQELVEKLTWALSNPYERDRVTVPLSEAMQEYDWRVVASSYDRKLSHLVAN